MITREHIRASIVPADTIQYRGLPFDPSYFIDVHMKQSAFLHEWAQRIEGMVDPSLPLGEQMSRAEELFPTSDTRFLDYLADADISHAVALGICAFRDIGRKSGLRYQTHLFKVAPMGEMYNESRDVEKRAMLVGNTHDVIEEGALKPFKKGKPLLLPLDGVDGTWNELDVVFSAREWLNDEFPGHFLGDSAVILTEPHIPDTFSHDMAELGYDPYVVEYGVFAEQIRLFADAGSIQAEIGDRLDDILNLSYITENPKLDPPQKYQKLLDKFAKCLFTVNYISRTEDGQIVRGVSERLVQVYCNLLERIAREHGVPLDEIVKKAVEYGDFITDHQDEIQTVIEDYLYRVGLLSNT